MASKVPAAAQRNSNNSPKMTQQMAITRSRLFSTIRRKLGISDDSGAEGLQARYTTPALNRRDQALGQDLNQFGLTSRNRDMELGTSNDGIGTALNIFGVTLLALLDPAEAIEPSWKPQKQRLTKVCENADSWSGSGVLLSSEL